MMAHPALFRIPLVSLLPFSHDGCAYRAFDHLILARPGALLLVPVWLATGNLKSVVDGCPVPWAEVFDVLDAPAESVSMGAVWLPPEVWAVLPENWQEQQFRLTLRAEPLRRFVHLSGVRFADLS